MNITKRITKFLLIAALAIPAWSTASAQNRTAPPENQILEEATSRSVAKRNAESRPSVKKESLKVSTSSTTPELTSSAIASPTKGHNRDRAKNSGSKREGAVNAPNRAGTVVSIPSGATIEEWDITTEWHKYNSGWTTPTFSSTVKVGFYGNDIYIAGLCDVFPDSWVKGTLSGSTVKFASGQYYGASDSSEYWFVGEDSDDNEVGYVEFSYDASKHKLVLQTAYITNKNAATGGSYYSYHLNTVIEKPTTVTIANGTGTNNIVPVYGWYHDISSNTSQMIYPGTYLSDIPNNALIKSITFYTNNDGIKFSGGLLTATIGTTTQSQFSSAALITISGTTSTATATPVSGATSLTFTFDTPFQYTTGDNLIIQTTNTTVGSCDPSSTDVTYWLGVSGSTPFGYNYKKGQTQSFMPKMYVVYEQPEATYEATLTGDGDFGVVKVGETATQTFVVTNEGSNAFTPVVTATGNGFTVTSTGSGQLASGASRNYTVTFAPTAVQNYSGTLTLTAQESEASAISASIGLSGTGVNEETVTVADGTVTGDLPVFLHYLDCVNHGQVIYPADSLGLTTGTLIKSISFYSNSDLNVYSGSANNTITLKLGETSQSTYSSVDFVTGLTTVATLTSSQLLNGTRVVTFTFNAPYEYQGGNLVVDASCPTISSGQYTSSSVQWVGKTVTGAGALYMYYTSSDNENSVQNFMPKMTMVVEMATGAPTTELDFGLVEVGSPKTMMAYIDNPSDKQVSATVTVAPNPPFSVASPTVTLEPNATTPVSVTFNPEGAQVYTGTLTVVAGDVTTTIPLKGVGTMSGPEAIRDEAFFEGIEYTWTDSDGKSHTSTLADIATEPEQIIAMIKEIYTNKDIPGNYTRGFTSAGAKDVYADVNYAGVGTIDATVSSSSISYSYEDGYGWNISGNLKTGNNGDYYYCYMDSTQYKPNNEGVTLLLVEINDVFDKASVQANNKTLKEYIQSAIKSVRVVTQAKRTGTGYNKGTLFNIDCDKMNKFYFMAKGQLRWIHNSYWAASKLFCANPCYIYDSYYGNVDGFYDDRSFQIFYNMFEEFSPVVNTSSTAQTDIYKDLVNMDSYSVVHDCMGIPYLGHQFEMYGSDSEAADCQDVRDLMFFVPDYRMMYWSGRDNSNYPKYQRYMNYNQSHAPTMGLYVIIQDTVQAVTRADDYFKLKLTWDSNMDEFMPGDQQEYQLYQVVTDEFGVSSWKPVYYTKVENNKVVYTDKNGNVVDTPVPIVLTMDPSSSKKTYAEVYVPRADASTEVTYAVRGQDTGHFLSLQMSNEQSYLIPGKDPAEMALMSSATVYSRYEAQNENNCYSNKLLLKSAPRTIKASYLPNGSTMTINRTHRVRENGQSVEVTVPIATLTVTNSGSNKYFTVSGPVLDASVKDLFPKGTHDGKTAGYHANTLTNIAYTTETVDGTEYMNFDIALWDNFVANVSKNEHPGLYTYQLNFNAVGFTGLNGTNEAYSNIIPVLVYKTDSRINEPLTLAQVQADVDCNPDYEPGDVEFSAQVMLSSKSEILRYDAYRWNEGAERSIVYDGGLTDEDEEDVDPNGIAGNQGDSYTVTMNKVGTDNYYVGNAVPVTETAPQNWAKFVDYYPATLTDGGSFTYAPVVELFTKGYQAGSTTAVRGDYNTYGGPLKTTAVGKIELEIPDNLNTAGNPFMSTYKWLDGEDWCAYYKIPVKFKVLGIPEGYELYKIRAWRDVDTDILREELPSRQDRIASNYLFEELTYGDALGDGHTMSKANLYQNNDGTVNSYELGRRAVENYDTDSNIQGETHATFGALRLDTKDGQPSSIKSLEATIKVRAYFTKAENPAITNKPIYVMADDGNGWDFSNPLATLYSTDGQTYTGTVTMPDANNGRCYFIFSKELGSDWNKPSNLFGAEWNDGDAYVDPTWNFYLKTRQNSTSKVINIAAGTYQMTITNYQKEPDPTNSNYYVGNLAITPVTAKASSRDLTAAEYPYYVAEGEVEFNSNMFNQIITGVTDVTTNSTREVMSVSYVNTIGQVSSTPWKGVNMVVTRYTDGSTSTTKVMK